MGQGGWSSGLQDITFVALLRGDDPAVAGMIVDRKDVGRDRDGG